MSQGISVQSTILHFRPTRRLQIAKGNCQILFMYVRLRNPSITLCTASLGDKLKNLKTDREKSWDVQTTKWGNKTTPPRPIRPHAGRQSRQGNKLLDKLQTWGHNLNPALSKQTMLQDIDTWKLDKAHSR